MATNIAGEILYSHRRIERNELKPGQHIFVFRAANVYTHHGIYVGKDSNNVQYVIHFLNNSEWKLSIGKSPPPCPYCGYRKKKDVGIVKTCVDCFMKKGNLLAGTILYLYNYNKTATKPLDQVVREAYEMLEKKNNGDGFGKYNLIVHNCEDFATYCSSGVEESRQVNRAALTLAATGTAVLVINVAKNTKKLLFNN